MGQHLNLILFLTLSESDKAASQKHWLNAHFCGVVERRSAFWIGCHSLPCCGIRQTFLMATKNSLFLIAMRSHGIKLAALLCHILYYVQVLKASFVQFKSPYQMFNMFRAQPFSG